MVEDKVGVWDKGLAVVEVPPADLDEAKIGTEAEVRAAAGRKNRLAE